MTIHDGYTTMESAAYVQDGSAAKTQYVLRCTSSLCLAIAAILMPASTPWLYRCWCMLLSIASVVHHAVEESIPQEQWASSTAYVMAFKLDGTCITGTCAAFCVCLWPALGACFQVGCSAAGAACGCVSRHIKIFFYVMTSIGTAMAQPDVVGAVAVVLNQMLAVCLCGMSIVNGSWYGPLHLWAWHMCSGVWLWFASRGLIAEQRPFFPGV